MRSKTTRALACLATIALAFPAALLRADDDHGGERDGLSKQSIDDSRGKRARPERDVRVRLRVRGRKKPELRVRVTVRNQGRQDLEQVEVTLHDGDPTDPLWSEVISLARRKRFRKKLRVPAEEVGAFLTAECRILGAEDDDPDDNEDTAAGPPAPPAPPASAAERGRDLYAQLCAACHGSDGRGGSASDDDIAEEDWDELFEAFREGEEGMPLFPSLTAGDAKDIAAFLRDPDGVPPAPPPVDPPTPPPTDPPAVPTYTADVKPILDTSCVACHRAGSGAGGIALDTYASASSAASVSLSSIRAGRMPLGGSLSAADIQVIADWVAAGKTP